MFIARCAALSVLLCGASESMVGHAQVTLDGDIGCVARSQAADAQDAAIALKLGEDQRQPSGRLAFDMDVPVFAGSGSMFDADTGALPEDFGGSSFLSAGAPVTDFDWSNAKAPPAIDVSLGPVTISRGFAADHFGFDLEGNEENGLASETVELDAPVPIELLQGAVDLGTRSGPEQVGCVEADIDDVQVRLLDVETVLTVHATSLLDLFVGYRPPELTADDRVAADPFDRDVAIRGLVIGGGVRF